MQQKALIIEKLNLGRLDELILVLDQYLPQIYESDYERWKIKLRNDFKEGKKIALAALLNNSLVGTAIYQSYPIVIRDVKTIELKTLLVIDEYRNHKQQVGSNLIERLKYEAQRTGYNRIIVDARHDNPIVPWLISKGFKITNFTREFEWLSYKLETKFPEIFTDDVDDPQLVLRWIMKKLNIFNPIPITTDGQPTYEGRLAIHTRSRGIEVNSKIRFCPDENAVKKFINIDRNDKKLFFYVLNNKANSLPTELVDEIHNANGNIIDSSDLKNILSVDYSIMKRSIFDSYCLAVLVYPDIIERIKTKFSTENFKIVITGKMGNLLNKDSRIIFVSNVDYAVQGAASFLSNKICEGKEETWEQCLDQIVFEKDEFMRWANIKKSFTVFELGSLKIMPQPTPIKIDEPELRMNKWAYYPYQIFMENMYQFLK